MATLDGYTPYPVTLTAEETVFAIKRAFNLDEELVNYIKRTLAEALPPFPNTGDFYSDNDRSFLAHVEGANTLWIEI